MLPGCIPRKFSEKKKNRSGSFSKPVNDDSSDGDNDHIRDGEQEMTTANVSVTKIEKNLLTHILLPKCLLSIKTSTY